MRTWRSWSHGAALALLGAALGSTGCSDTASCTEIGCESEAVVTFPAGVVTGPFDLVIEGSGMSVTLRCSDPGAPETADNPPGIRCDAQGFSIEGHPLADEREVAVAIIPTDGSEQIQGVVRMDAVEEITPNGPDCPPVCVVRNGQLRAPGQG
ncbi:MAG: hypothetical protein KDK70_14525 [Myxococcales bacterium]|nr:hypothetical protein [Myxococcales bacterium]